MLHNYIMILFFKTLPMPNGYNIHNRARCYLNQSSQAVKKECGPQKGQGEKDVKSKVAAKKWL